MLIIIEPKSGNAYCRSSIREILLNEKYTGVYTYNVRSSKDGRGKINSRKKKLSDEIIRVENGIPQIISRETFDRVRQIFDKRRRQGGSFTAKHDYLLSGKIRCGECGSAYIGNYQKATERFPEYISYRCSRKNTSAKCSSKSIKCRELEMRILSLLADKVFDEKLYGGIVQHYSEYARSQNKELTIAREQCESSLQSIETQIGNIVNVIAQTGSSALSERLNELEKSKELCMNELADINIRASENECIDEQTLRSAFDKARDMLINGTLENRREIIEHYINSVVIYRNRIEVVINIDGDFSITETLIEDNHPNE